MNDPSAPTEHGHDLDTDAAAESGGADASVTASTDVPAPVDLGSADAASSGVNAIDLDAIERDLNDVQTALERLNDGSYWTDEITGEPIPDELLTAHPTARAATHTPSGSTPSGSTPSGSTPS